MAQGPLAEIGRAVDDARCRFDVELAGGRVAVRADDEYARHACDFVFGRQAWVGESSRDEVDARTWTVAALRSDDVYDACCRLASRGRADQRRAPRLATYWKDDHAAERMTGSRDLALIRHHWPFLGLTLCAPARRLVLYARQRSERLDLPHLEHLVSYTLRAGCWSRGFVDVHAALLRYRGRGLLLSGPRRAGKTSLAMHLLRRGADLLGSDMGALQREADGGFSAGAMPHVCRITRATIADNPLLAQAIGSTYDQNRNFLRGPVFAGGKFELYAPAVDRIFGRHLHIRSMRIDGVFFPRFTIGAERQRIERLPAAAAGRRLASSVGADRPAGDWLPFPDVCRREESERGMMNAPATSPLGFFELEFGRSPSLDWHEIDDVVDSL